MTVQPMVKAEAVHKSFGLAHILNLIPYKKVPREKVKLPKRSMKDAYDDQASLKGRKFVPEKY